MYIDFLSDEPLEIIRANECESDLPSLATRRFRTVFNEVERLLADIERRRELALQDHNLTREWMDKHDKLLGFIQARPAMLAELIRETNN